MRYLLIIFTLLYITQPACAVQVPTTQLSGHLKTLNLVYGESADGLLKEGIFSANNLRFALHKQLLENLEFQVALDTLLLYSNPPGQVGLPAESPNHRLTLEKDWNAEHRWSAKSTFDRLSIKGSSGDFDWEIGRQAVGFGRITLFSPLDVIAPFAPTTLDTDIRPGVDALRGVKYFGLGGQFGGMLILGDERENNSSLLTFSENAQGIDLLVIGGSLRGRELVGLGLAGSLGPLGIKLELSHYWGKDIDIAGGDLHTRFDIAALELWYRFENGLILLTEYLYNGAGAADPNDYLAAAASAPYREGLSFLLGQQYLLIGPSWELHPLMTLSGLLIRNLDDDSTLLRPQVQCSLGDNLSLDLFYSFNIGPKPQALTPTISVPQSEFGSAGDSGGMLLRWYF